MKVAFFTLGCKVNQYETEVLTAKFKANGFEVVSTDESADVYVVNSCTVTASGDKKTRQTLRKFKRANPDSVVALTGCFPQAFPDVASKIPEADVITGSYNRQSLFDSVMLSLTSGKRVIDITPHKKGEEFEKMSVSSFSDRTRAFVKIEDGCDRYCSYCIIPTARGPIRSKSLDDLNLELEQIANAGYKEVVLVGINLSSYGKDTGYRLIDAIELACSIDGIERVRLGSLEPELLTDDDIKRMASQSKMCPQFHLSLQSGCDETLKRMNRHYTSAEYYEIVEKIRKHFDNSSITTDVMVGFAGETQEEFKKSLEFVEKVGFAKVHVFPYSIREGTVAAKMPNQVVKSDKEKRASLMAQTAQNSADAFLQEQLGKVEKVLFETKTADGGYRGYTPNYADVKVLSNEDLSGLIKSVKMVRVEKDYIIGEIV